jgi:integrase
MYSTILEDKRHPYSKALNDYHECLVSSNTPHHTIENYCSYVHRFLLWVIDNYGYTDMETAPHNIFWGYQSYLLEAGLKGNSVNQNFCAVKSFLEAACGRVISSKAVRTVKYDKYRGPVPTSQEVVVMLNSADNPRTFMAIAIMASCGLRVSELVELRYSDIRRDRKTLYVHPSKNHMDREVPLPEELLSHLADYCRHFTKMPRKDDFIFPGRSPGKPVTTATIENDMSKLMESLNWKDRGYTCHALRRYFGCKYYLSNFGDTNSLAAIMGHQSLSSTFVYVQLAAAFRAVESEIKGIHDTLHQAVPSWK